MLVTMKYLLDIANEGNFAVPAPNIQNELTARGVIREMQFPSDYRYCLSNPPRY